MRVVVLQRLVSGAQTDHFDRGIAPQFPLPCSTDPNRWEAEQVRKRMAEVRKKYNHPPGRKETGGGTDRASYGRREGRGDPRRDGGEEEEEGDGGGAARHGGAGARGNGADSTEYQGNGGWPGGKAPESILLRGRRLGEVGDNTNRWAAIEWVGEGGERTEPPRLLMPPPPRRAPPRGGEG